MIERYMSFLERRGWVYQGSGSGYVWFARGILGPLGTVVRVHKLSIFTDGHYSLNGIEIWP